MNVHRVAKTKVGWAVLGQVGSDATGLCSLPRVQARQCESAQGCAVTFLFDPGVRARALALTPEGSSHVKCRCQSVHVSCQGAATSFRYLLELMLLQWKFPRSESSEPVCWLLSCNASVSFSKRSHTVLPLASHLTKASCSCCIHFTRLYRILVISRHASHVKEAGQLPRECPSTLGTVAASFGKRCASSTGCVDLSCCTERSSMGSPGRTANP